MAGACYQLKAKNGQVCLYDDGRVVIGRAGWFGRAYQLLTRGRSSFSAGDIARVTLKEPSLTRGYLRFELGDSRAGRSVVWLTSRDMVLGARHVKRWVEAQGAGRAACPGERPGGAEG